MCFEVGQANSRNATLTRSTAKAFQFETVLTTREEFLTLCVDVSTGATKGCVKLTDEPTRITAGFAEVAEEPTRIRAGLGTPKDGRTRFGVRVKVDDGRRLSKTTDS